LTRRVARAVLRCSAEQSVIARRGGRAGWFVARSCTRDAPQSAAARRELQQTRSPSSIRSIVRVGPGEPDGHVHDRSDHVISDIASIRRPRWIMHRRVPSARCSATHTCSGTRDLAGRLVLPSDRPAALLGFVVADCLSFAGLIPHGGWRPCHHGSGPTCRFAFLSAPIYFRRGDSRFRPVSNLRHLQVFEAGRKT